MSKLSNPYPKARRSDHVDVIHDVEVPDPYRWMEEIDSPETHEWIKEQNKLTYGYLEQIPEREEIRERMTELWNFEKYGIPFKREGRYFYTKNDGLQNQSVLYYVDGLHGELVTLLDPNLLSEDGTVALTGLGVSRDGEFLAYGVSSAGSDWQEWRIRDVESGKDMDDHLEWIKFTEASWTLDDNGFYYSRFDEPKGDVLKEANYYQKLYYHRLGDPQSEDKLVYKRDDEKEWRFYGHVTEDGRYLVITVTKGTYPETQIFVKDLEKDSEVIELITGFDAKYRFIANDGPILYLLTDKAAPMSRVVTMNIEEPGKFNEVIPEADDALQTVSMVSDKLLAIYLKDAHSVIKIFSKEGAHIREIELPGMGTVTGFTGKQKDSEAFYQFTSFTYPGSIYRIDLKNDLVEVYKEPELEFIPEGYVTNQVFYKSKDGTRVPLYIVHKKGVESKAYNQCYLYGYGGFNISLTPFFNVRNLVWMERGGLFCLANLRGGAEYGKEWHDQGIKLSKQNVFDDFIAAAEYLIEEGYTCTPRLAISGRSNGGLLTGACLVQRPELYGVTVPVVGVLDMLRFEKFTVGWAWSSDYGSVKNMNEFNALLAYSPYHNLEEGTSYPPTMVTTADHDDRVYPAHSFKFAAALQHAHTGDAPALIRIESKAGHGMGKPTAKVIEEYTDELTFITANLKDAN
ncbi:MAG: prolyl oligopeptidase family serine peptidase [Candidatus Bathyarchaeota archaeon]|nr:prolyl oligopeptidase family serine peptidase [Candidatus Bathyarchaeota archaeon]